MTEAIRPHPSLVAVAGCIGLNQVVILAVLLDASLQAFLMLFLIDFVVVVSH